MLKGRHREACRAITAGIGRERRVSENAPDLVTRDAGGVVNIAHDGDTVNEKATLKA